MKTIKLFMVMSLMLIMGNVCIAQEEMKKDSIWGLEWSQNCDTFNCSFYVKLFQDDNFEGITFNVYYDENKPNSYKSEGLFPTMPEQNGIAFDNFELDSIDIRLTKVTIVNGYLIDEWFDKDKIWKIAIYVYSSNNLEVLYENCKTSSLNEINTNDIFDYKYYLLSGIECKGTEIGVPIVGFTLNREGEIIDRFKMYHRN